MLRGRRKRKLKRRNIEGGGDKIKGEHEGSRTKHMMEIKERIKRQFKEKKT